MNDKFWDSLTFQIENRTEQESIVLGKGDDVDVNYFWKEIWFPLHADSLSHGFAIAVFDSAFLHGVSRTKKWMMETGGSWRKLLNLRRIYMIDQMKKNPSLKPKFKRWLARLNQLDKYITIIERDIKESKS